MGKKNLLEHKIHELELENARLRQQIQSYQEKILSESVDHGALASVLENHRTPTKKGEGSKRAKATLTKIEHLYRKAIEVGGAVPYYQNYLTDTYDFVGEGIQSLIGYSPEELTPKLWEDITLEIILLGDLTNLSLEEAVQKARGREGVSWRADYRVKSRSGEERWLMNAAIQVFDEQGQVIGSLGILQDITERKRAEEALRESQFFYASLVENIPQCIFRKDLDGRVTYIDPTFCKLLGKSSEAVIGKTDFDLYPMDLAEKYRRDDQTVLESGKRFETIEENQTPDGQRIFVQVIKSPLFDINGKVIGLQGIFWDISERIRMEEALRESERVLSTLMSNLPGMAYRCRNDREWTMSFVSEGTVELTGYESSELIDNRIVSYEDLIHPADQDRVWIQVQEALNRHQSFQLVYRIHTKAGREKWVWEQGRGIYSVDGTLLCLEGFIIDITENKRVQEALQESEKRFRSLVEQINYLVWRFTLNGVFTYLSPSVKRFTGYEPDELIGQSFECVLTKESLKTAYDSLKKRKQGDYGSESVLLELTHICRDGSEFIGETQSTPIFNSSGDLIEIQGITRDITEHKKEEAERYLRAQRIEKQKSAIIELMSSEVVWTGDFTLAMYFITELAAKCAEVERVSIWLLNPDRNELYCRDLFEQSNQQHTDGYVLNGEEFGPEIDYLKHAGFIDAHDARTDSRTAVYTEKYLEPLGITSKLDAPIRASGKVIGILCLEHVGVPRVWQGDEITFACAVADQIAQVLANLERFWAEEALRESEERLTRIVETSPVGIILINREGRITFANTTAENISGLSRIEMTTRMYDAPEWNISKLDGKPIPNEENPIQRILRDGVPVYGYELAIISADGTKKFVSVNASPLRDLSGAILGVVAVCTDITDRRLIEEDKARLEERFRQAQKMEAVGQLAGGVAHDFNNLLTAITGYTNIALAKLEPERTAIRSYLDQVLQSANRAAMLTRQLLAFSRREIMHCKNVDLNEVIANLIRMLRRIIGEQIELHTRFEQDLHTVYVDPGQIEQILMNLCVNARDAMPNGGVIWIETENVTLDRPYEEANSRIQAGDYVKLSISDNGMGMSPEVLEHVFEPFFTTKEVGKGTGLGLATVYGIVKQHNGLIHVYSEANQGTVFRIYFPAVAVDIKRQVDHQEMDKNLGGTETILVAEDEELVRDLVKTILEQAGYQVLLAKDGEEAILMFQQFADRIDLALLDVIMPKKSGKVVADQIRATPSQIPILFSSGYDYPVLSMNNTLEAQVDLIQKPYNPGDLLRIVREKLDAAKKTKKV